MYIRGIKRSAWCFELLLVQHEQVSLIKPLRWSTMEIVTYQVKCKKTSILMTFWCFFFNHPRSPSHNIQTLQQFSYS